MAALTRAAKFDTSDPQAFIELQNQIVDPRYAATGWRTVQSFVGETMSDFQEHVHFVFAKPENLADLMNGWMRMMENLRDAKVDPVCAAASASFGFVFIHPFEDGNGETLVLFDRNMIDDELFALWARFRPGVRILFISDSCHSGTVAQIDAGDEGFFHTEPSLLDEDGKPRLLKSVSSFAQQRHYARFRGMYNAIRAALPDRSQVVVRASVIQLGACQDANPPLSYTSRASLFWIHASSNAVSRLCSHDARSKLLR